MKKWNYYHLFFFLILSILISISVPTYAKFTYESLWKTLLVEHTKPGTHSRISTTLVDYTAFYHSQSFKTILRYLKQFDTDDLTTLSEKKAFWINTYNIAAIHLILSYYPIKSLQEIGSPELPFEMIPIININNNIYSLNDIFSIIRTEFDDPRLLFCLSNGAISAPNLATTPYQSHLIEKQVSAQFKAFISNKSKGVKIRKGTKSAHLSPLFLWYQSYLPSQDPSPILSFLKPFYPFLSNKYTVYYFKYNWTLNNKKIKRKRYETKY